MDANGKPKSNRRLTQMDTDRISERRHREFAAHYLRQSPRAGHSFGDGWFSCGLHLSSRSFVFIRGFFSSVPFVYLADVAKGGRWGGVCFVVRSA
jgi:hypothetical protein